MEAKVLDPIKIAVIAPTGAGKTALISTVCDYIKMTTNKAKGYTLEIENSAAQEMNKFKIAVSAQLAGQNMSFESALVEPTKDPTVYKFSMNFTDKTSGISIKQPFDIMDIPGAFINNPLNYTDDDKYQKFVSHLDTSRILWIPIDTPILMECETSNEKSMSDLIRCTPNLMDFCVEWAQFAAENGKLDFCNFVFIKCEKYFSHDILNEYNGCMKRFDEAYGSIIRAIKNQNTDDKLACVAVETIGSAKANNGFWSDKGFKCEYVATGKERVIRGVDCLLKDALLVAINNINAEIDLQKAAKESDKTKYNAHLKVLIDEQNQKIREMENKKNELENKTNEMYRTKRKVEDAGILEVIIAALLKPFGVGNLNELKEKVRNIEAHRLSLITEIEREKNKLDELHERVNVVKNNVANVEQEIYALDNVKEWFYGLSAGNSDSKYYRSL